MQVSGLLPRKIHPHARRGSHVCTMITGERCSSDLECAWKRKNSKREIEDSFDASSNVIESIERGGTRRNWSVAEIETRQENFYIFKKLRESSWSGNFFTIYKKNINGRCKIQEVEGDLILSKRFRRGGFFLSFFSHPSERPCYKTCMPLARAELRGRVFKSDATMCNRCRKLLLFNDFLVAPTTIVACISCARNERSGNDYFISACLHPFFFLFFFLVAYLLLESGYSCQLYELYYYDRYSREREREVMLLVSRDRDIEESFDQSMLSPFNKATICIEFARNKTSWSSLNIHEDRSSYRRLQLLITISRCLSSKIAFPCWTHLFLSFSLFFFFSFSRMQSNFGSETNDYESSRFF